MFNNNVCEISWNHFLEEDNFLWDYDNIKDAHIDVLNFSCRFSVVAQAQLNSASTVTVRKDSSYDGAASSALLHEAIEMNSSPSPNPRGTSGPSSSTSSSPPPRGTACSNSQLKRNGNSTSKPDVKRFKTSGSLFPFQLGRSPSFLTGSSSCKKDRKMASSGSRFTIYKANKASKKKREKSSAKRERKATKTLAIVLGKDIFVILIYLLSLHPYSLFFWILSLSYFPFSQLPQLSSLTLIALKSLPLHLIPLTSLTTQPLIPLTHYYSPHYPTSRFPYSLTPPFLNLTPIFSTSPLLLSDH